MPRGAPDWFYGAPQKTLVQLLREANVFYMFVSTTNSPGNYTFHQLWNPADSGVGAMVWGLGYKASAGCEAPLYFDTTQLTGLEGHGSCRFGGKPSSQIETRWEWDNWLVWQHEMGRYSVATTWQYDEEMYIWLPPGRGLNFVPSTLNLAVENNFIWFEFVEY